MALKRKKRDVDHQSLTWTALSPKCLSFKIPSFGLGDEKRKKEENHIRGQTVVPARYDRRVPTLRWRACWATDSPSHTFDMVKKRTAAKTLSCACPAGGQLHGYSAKARRINQVSGQTAGRGQLMVALSSRASQTLDDSDWLFFFFFFSFLTTTLRIRGTVMGKKGKREMRGFQQTNFSGNI